MLYKFLLKPWLSKNYLYGIYAEYLSIILYTIKGYKLLKHRFKYSLGKYDIGEIDLIFKKGEYLVFVEVKARRKHMGMLNLSSKQLSRIKNASKLFVLKNKDFLNFSSRFDVVTLQGYFNIRIIENAW